MHRTPRLITVLALAAACAACGSKGSSANGPDAAPAVDGSPDGAPPPPYWQPKPGDAKNWDIQLAAPFDTSAQRTAYVLDLWSVVPNSTELDYGDGDPVTVPAGAQATTIAALHATTPPTVVVCRIDTGALELARPDARKFPGYTKGMTTCPKTPAAGSAIGTTALATDECWLDISTAGRAAWDALMWKRIDLAKTIGCDAVLGDHNDFDGYTTGFATTPQELEDWYGQVATQIHGRTLSAGMKDANEINGTLQQLAPDYDWYVVQRCAEYDDCDTTRPFINLQKAVLAIDYQPDAKAMTGIDPTAGCPLQLQAMIDDGLVKDEALSSAFRVQCGI